MTDLIRVGSETAKGGFANERDIANKFEKWKTDKEAQKWLKIMGYNLDEIKNVEATILHGEKTDVQIKVTVTLKNAISIQNLSIKKTNKNADYNQIDKRWVNNYIEMWNIPNDIVFFLKLFCGEIPPLELLKQGKMTKEKYSSLRDKRRFYLDEFNEEDKEKILNFFNKNKMLVIADILKGRGKFSADWILVTRLDKDKNETAWVLADINKAMSIFGEGEVKKSPQGSISIGRITLQRKGGDGGRITGNMLQFKIRPCDLFRY